MVARALDALADEVNAGTTDGSGLAARAAQLSQYFTDDVVIDLGPGTSEVRGRATVLDMMSRLQPRTSAFQLRLTDTGVTLGPDQRSADAVLTAEFIRRGGGEDSIDARELRHSADQSRRHLAHPAPGGGRSLPVADAPTRGKPSRRIAGADRRTPEPEAELMPDSDSVGRGDTTTWH